MAITLGRNAATAPPIGGNIISAVYTSECETIDISDRTTGQYRATAAGFTTESWEIECHDPDGLIAELESVETSGWQVMSVTENITLDGAVTYQVTLKEVS